jgi:hypothetical protein
MAVTMNWSAVAMRAAVVAAPVTIVVMRTAVVVAMVTGTMGALVAAAT